jgi:hypothetical protein
LTSATSAGRTQTHAADYQRRSEAAGARRRDLERHLGGGEQRAEPRPRASGIGPADNHEFLAVQAFDLEPQAAVAGRVGRIGAFRDDPFERLRAGLLMERGPVLPGDRCNAGASSRSAARRRAAPRAQSAGRALTSLPSRYRRSNRKNTSAAALPLSDAAWIILKEVDAVGAHTAQLAVEIGLPGAKRRHGGGDRRIFVGPVEPGAGQQPHSAEIEARMHAVAVKLDFVQ